MIHNSTLSIYPAMHQKTRVDPVRDFVPLSLVLVLPQMLVSHPSLPTRDVKELITFIKARPGKLDFAAGGVGGNPHMSMELFLGMAGLKATYVPYKSGNAGLVDVLSGQVPLMMGSMLTVLPHVRQARLRAYGVTGARRAAAAPEVPTIAEAGVPGYESIQWFGMFAPAGTARDIVQRLHLEIARAVLDPEMRKRFATDGGDPQSSRSPEDFANFLRADMAKWAQVVKAAGIKPTP
jgi:tripartite-type tricarboxylate transporter receptor subunit TctC